jgi:hypothetical protein
MPSAENRQDHIDAAMPGARARAYLRNESGQFPRKQVITAIALALLLHLGLAIWLVKISTLAPLIDKDRIEVTLLDPPVPASPLPDLPEPPQKPRPSAPSATLPRSHPAVMPAPAHTEQPANPTTPSTLAEAPLQLYTPDGAIKIPAQAPTAHEAGIARGKELLNRGHNLLHCLRGRFAAKYGNPPDVDRAGRLAEQMMLAKPDPNPDPIKPLIAAEEGKRVREKITAEIEAEEQLCDDDFYHLPPLERKK